VQKVKPDECYHLAAQSSVSYSFEDEFSTLQINVQGTHHLLASLKEARAECKFYFAGTSEMFGNVASMPQDETTPFHPRSTYGISKVSGFHLTRYYREAYKLFAVSGIAFNHESPRRGFEFVTRKISSHVARIKTGLEKELHLGNLDVLRDWGHAKDFVRGMWLMLQAPEPKDYVLATGEAHTVREFCETCFRCVGLRYEDYTTSDAAFYRPSEANQLVGNAVKAHSELGWRPEVSFQELVREMVEADCELARREKKAML
jgi:GDPmannose 4,6-dehydratase